MKVYECIWMCMMSIMMWTMFRSAGSKSWTTVEASIMSTTLTVSLNATIEILIRATLNIKFLLSKCFLRASSIWGSSTGMASLAGGHASSVPGHCSGRPPGTSKDNQPVDRITDQNNEQAKKELVTVKQQRLSLAQDEWNHLNSTLSHLSNSTTSCKWQPSLSKSMFLSRFFSLIL